MITFVTGDGLRCLFVDVDGPALGPGSSAQALSYLQQIFSGRFVFRSNFLGFSV